MLFVQFYQIQLVTSLFQIVLLVCIIVKEITTTLLQKKKLEESLKKDYKLPTTGYFSVKNNKIRIQYYLNGPESSKSKQSFREYTGIVLNDSTFVLTEYLDFRFKKITMLYRTYHFQKFN